MSKASRRRSPTSRDERRATIAAKRDACDHDWRVNPHVALMSFPPQSQLVCALCGEKRASGSDWQPLSNDPATWPKWQGA